MTDPEQKLFTNQQVAVKMDEIDWERAWQSLYRRRWFILTVSSFVFILSALFTSSMPDLYTAQTSILVERIDDKPLHYKEVLMPMGEQGPAYYETKVALLKSRPILEQTVIQLNLIEHYQKKNRRVKNVDDAVRILQKRIGARVLGRTQIIRVDVEDTSSKMAADIANRLSENFVREAWRERFFISDQLLEWFPDEAKTLQKNSPIKQLEQLSQDQMISSLPSIMQDPVVNRIKEDRMKVDAEIRELSRRYTPQHPKMKELRAKGDYLESELKAHIEKIISGLKAGLAGQFSANSIKIVESANVPSQPSGHQRMLIVLGCTLLAALFSAWVAILMEYVNRRIRTEDDIERLSLPFLGYLPLITGLKRVPDSNSVLDVVDSDARLRDDIMTIRTSFLFSMPRDRAKLMMCTSATPGEGKSTLVAMLGVSLAESGSKVLLVDADMRNPVLHKIFRLENKEGLSACLAGMFKGGDLIQPLANKPMLHVMTAGKRPPNPVLLLGSEAMTRLISELSNEYDKIIFDVPPALLISDALILAEKMHGVILLFDAGKVHQTTAKKLIEKITIARGSVIGAVMNRVEYQKLDYKAYQYYHQYEKYYRNTAETAGNPNG